MKIWKFYARTYLSVHRDSVVINLDECLVISARKMENSCLLLISIFLYEQSKLFMLVASVDISHHFDSLENWLKNFLSTIAAESSCRRSFQINNNAFFIHIRRFIHAFFSIADFLILPERGFLPELITKKIPFASVMNCICNTGRKGVHFRSILFVARNYMAFTCQA